MDTHTPLNWDPTLRRFTSKVHDVSCLSLLTLSLSLSLYLIFIPLLFQLLLRLFFRYCSLSFHLFRYFSIIFAVLLTCRFHISSLSICLQQCIFYSLFLFLFFSLSFSHTHTHTHTQTLSLSLTLLQN